MAELRVRTSSRCEMVDLGGRLEGLIPKGFDGVCCLFALHTTCGLTVNENADPAVKSDVLLQLSRIVPKDAPGFTHCEGNSDAHIKTLMAGPSLCLPVRGGELLLGTWQGVYLCEFDGPRERRIAVTLVKEFEP